MTSKLYRGKVEHARLAPVKHAFNTRVGFVALDFEDLERLDREITGFGFNRFAPVSIRQKDYLNSGPQSFTEKLAPWIACLELTEKVGAITLVTSPRWWGKVFNPVSFYLLRNEQSFPMGLIAEVNNTFSDRHIYAVPLTKAEGILQADHAKEFHVSPFNDMTGNYQFTVRETDKTLYIGVDLYRDGDKVLIAWIEGEGQSFTTANLWKYYLRHPLQPWLTMPRIVWQAIFLKFQHKLKVFKRPEPDHPATLLHRGRPAP
jgi:DUF1365 family protein